MGDRPLHVPALAGERCLVSTSILGCRNQPHQEVLVALARDSCDSRIRCWEPCDWLSQADAAVRVQMSSRRGGKHGTELKNKKNSVEKRNGCSAKAWASRAYTKRPERAAL